MRLFKTLTGIALAAGLMAASVPASANALGEIDNAKASAKAKEVHCIALNIYFEARSESLMGKVAVGHVVMNRVLSPRFPRSACDVIQQGGQKRLHRCQFSWWCDGKADAPKHARSWSKAMKIAKLIYAGEIADPTQGALWYHADYVNPRWRRAFDMTVKIGRHMFYVPDRERKL